jgi:hypothetical protein
MKKINLDSSIGLLDEKTGIIAETSKISDSDGMENTSDKSLKINNYSITNKPRKKNDTAGKEINLDNKVNPLDKKIETIAETSKTSDSNGVENADDKNKEITASSDLDILLTVEQKALEIDGTPTTEKDMEEAKEAYENIKKTKELQKALQKLREELDNKDELTKDLKEKIQTIEKTEKKLSKQARKTSSAPQLREDRKNISKDRKALEKEIKETENNLIKLEKRTIRYKINDCIIKASALSFAYGSYDTVGSIFGMTNFSSTVSDKIKEEIKNPTGDIRFENVMESLFRSAGLPIKALQNALITLTMSIVGGFGSALEKLKMETGKSGILDNLREVFKKPKLVPKLLLEAVKGMATVLKGVFTLKTFFTRKIYENVNLKKDKIENKKRELEEREKRINKIVQNLMTPEELEELEKEKIEKEQQEKRKKTEAERIFNEIKTSIEQLNSSVEEKKKELGDIHREIAKQKSSLADKSKKLDKKERRGIKEKIKELEKSGSELSGKIKEESGKIKKWKEGEKELLKIAPHLKNLNKVENEAAQNKKEQKEKQDFEDAINDTIELKKQIEECKNELSSLSENMEKTMEELKNTLDSEEKKKLNANRKKLTEEIEKKQEKIRQLNKRSTEYKINELRIAITTANIIREGYNQAEGIIESVVDNALAVIKIFVPIDIPIVSNLVDKAFACISNIGKFTVGFFAGMISCAYFGVRNEKNKLLGFAKGIKKGFKLAMSSLLDLKVIFSSKNRHIDEEIKNFEKQQERLKNISDEADKRMGKEEKQNADQIITDNSSIETKNSENKPEELEGTPGENKKIEEGEKIEGEKAGEVNAEINGEQTQTIAETPENTTNEIIGDGSKTEKSLSEKLKDETLKKRQKLLEKKSSSFLERDEAKKNEEVLTKQMP